MEVVEWSLDSTRSVLAALGDPQARYATLHVGGTNGKGSVAAVLASVLGSSGRRVGLYTSPHLCAFRERMRIGGEPISRRAVTEAAAEAYGPIAAGGLSYFEAATVLAFVAFARARVEVAVIEVGLGGRLDATNVITPVLSVITGVSFDHQETLGSTLSGIAREKAGIIKPGVPLVTGARDPEVLSVLREVAAREGAPLFEADPAAVRVLEADSSHSLIRLGTRVWGPLDLRVPMAGIHQAENVAVAVLGLQCLPPDLVPGRDAVESGVAGVRWPGRLQVERAEGRTWVFDVAHNPDGARALAAALKGMDLPHPRVAVIGVLGDKDWASMVPAVAASMDEVILTDPPSAPDSRRWDPFQARDRLAPSVAATAESDFGRALTLARRRSVGGTVVVTGSHHTVGDALLELGWAPCQPG